MKKGKEVKVDTTKSPESFGSFGRFNSLFTRPFSSMFGSNLFGTTSPVSETHRVDASKGPVIEEFYSDDEAEEGIERRESKDKPSVEHPDDHPDADAAEKKSSHANIKIDPNKVERPPAYGYSFSKVTYGGVNGAYCSSSVSRRTGGDGIMVEESRVADKTTGQAAHRFSRGVHDKGHSVTRTLNPDGNVDTVQTLHNLNQDELAGFEETWKNKQFPDWKEGLNSHGDTGFGRQDRQSMWGSLALPYGGRFGEGRTENGARTSEPFSGRAKKVVRIPIE